MERRLAGRLKLHLYGLAVLAVDRLPGFVVRTDAYRRLRRLVSRVPRRFEPYPPSAERRPGQGQWLGRKLATRETDLVIDGFPGSANTYVSNSIRDALGADLQIESHFHYIVQLERALAFGVPAVVIVREPLAACSSAKSKEPRFADGFLLARWILYHRYVRRRLGELGVFFFDEVTADLDVVRASWPGVARLASRPIEGNPAYRRASGEAGTIEPAGAFDRWLAERAVRLYATLRSERGPLRSVDGG